MKIDEDRSNITFLLQGPYQTELPIDCTPIIVKKKTATSINTDQAPIKEIAKEKTRNPENFLQYLIAKQPWIEELLQMNREVNVDLCKQIIEASKLYLASDGDKDDNILTFGWVIANDHEILIKGMGHVQPAHKESSLRGEAYGSLKVFQIFDMIMKYYHFQENQKEIQFISDNTSLFRRVPQKQRSPCETLKSEYETIEGTKACVKRYHNVNTHHIKSHQNNKEPTWHETLNKRCNEIATLVKEQCRPSKLVTLLQSEATLIFAGKEVPAPVDMSMCDAYNVPQLFEYQNKKYEWNNEIQTIIQWKVLG